MKVAKKTVAAATEEASQGMARALQQALEQGFAEFENECRKNMHGLLLYHESVVMHGIQTAVKN
jgi:hypothetical protein